MHQLLRFLSLFFTSNGSLLGVKRQKYRLYLTSDQILQSFAFIKYSYASWYTNCNLVFFFYANINLNFPTGCKHRPRAWGFRFTKGAKANKTPRWRWNIVCLSCNFFLCSPSDVSVRWVGPSVIFIILTNAERGRDTNWLWQRCRIPAKMETLLR